MSITTQQINDIQRTFATVAEDVDGVIVAPRKVTEYAHEILMKDKNARTQLYKDLKMEPDKTVNPN